MTAKVPAVTLLGALACSLLLPAGARAEGLLPSQPLGGLAGTAAELSDAAGGTATALGASAGEVAGGVLAGALPAAGETAASVGNVVAAAGAVAGSTTAGAGHALSRTLDRTDDLLQNTTGIDLLPEQPVPAALQPRFEAPAPKVRAGHRLQPKERTSPSRPAAERDPASAEKPRRRAAVARAGRRPFEDGGLQTIKDLAFPIVLALAAGAFLVLQHYIDRRDPKLAHAPLDDDLLTFT